MKSLKGKIAIVTGASRGVGKGIALGLAEAGATVYVTGRKERGENLPEFLIHTSIERTAEEATKLGGQVFPYACDHENDDEVEALFKHVEEKHGQIDILVNNAWGGSMHAMGEYYFNTPFWNQPQSLWDDHYKVGVRSNYVASRYGAQMMSLQKSGMIVNISFFAGRHYMNNVAYGVCKSTIDRMSEDMALELKDFGVKVFALYPGHVRTEGMIEYAKYSDAVDLSKMESPQFIGRTIAALAMDEQAIEMTGQILIAAEVAENYGITDIDGNKPESLRSVLW
jgi:dehydrogenase/reductase SDR family protein 1